MGRSIGVSGMGWRSRRASKRALACFAVFGVGGIAGLVAGFSADPVLTSELSPAETVALRFPGGASRIAAARIAPSFVAPNLVVPSPGASDDGAPPSALAETDPTPGPTGYMLASAAESDASSLMFSPFPTYSSPAYASVAVSSPAYSPPAKVAAPHPLAPPQLPPQLASASIQLPAEALAYATPGADEPPEPIASTARPESAAPAKRLVAPPHPVAPPSASNAVLNAAQIASIKERLKLTSYQSQLWPPVESALRDISYQGRADASGRKLVANAKGGTIDPNSVPVQRLKSAAFPLIMSLSEDQKQEVRTMVRLMGLENLASQF
jgi:hypothetical protein